MSTLHYSSPPRTPARSTLVEEFKRGDSHAILREVKEAKNIGWAKKVFPKVDLALNGLKMPEFCSKRSNNDDTVRASPAALTSESESGEKAFQLA